MGHTCVRHGPHKCLHQTDERHRHERYSHERVVTVARRSGPEAFIRNTLAGRRSSAVSKGSRKGSVDDEASAAIEVASQHAAACPSWDERRP